MEKLQTIWNNVTPDWHTTRGTVFWGFATAFASSAPISGFGAPWPITIAVSSIVGALVSILLYLKAKPPRNKSDQIAIALSISPETETDRALIRRDLIRNVEETFARNSQTTFPVLIVPEHLHFDGSDSNKAFALMRRMNVRLLAWGDLRKRKSNGEDVFILTIYGGVAHEPAAKMLQEVFSHEMRAILPYNAVLKCANELTEFYVLSEDFAWAITYIIAVSEILSARYDDAQVRLNTILQGSLGPQTASRAKVIALAKNRALACYLARSSIAHARWRISRHPEDLSRMDRILDDYLALAGMQDGNYLIGKSICDVVLRGDIQAARKKLTASQQLRREDPTTLYGLAFLSAVDGDLNGAYSLYSKAIKADQRTEATSLTGEPTAFEIEEFIDWYLSEHPDLVQLHFCLGYLNMERKRDLISARTSFEAFVADSRSSKFRTSSEAAHRYLEHRL